MTGRQHCQLGLQTFCWRPPFCLLAFLPTHMVGLPTSCPPVIGFGPSRHPHPAIFCCRLSPRSTATTISRLRWQACRGTSRMPMPATSSPTRARQTRRSSRPTQMSPSASAGPELGRLAPPLPQKDSASPKGLRPHPILFRVASGHTFL